MAERLTVILFLHRLDKVLFINAQTGIKMRSSVVLWDSPLFTQPTVPSIEDISKIFLTEGVALSVSAARQAIEESGIHIEEITHVVATTCTNTSNPGYDLLVARELGLLPTVERVLLHGVGCSGGLAGLRLASSLCHTAAWRGKPAHILVVACEINSSLGRFGLDSIDREQDVRVGPVLFGDGAGALVVSLDHPIEEMADNDCAIKRKDTGIFEVISCTHTVIPQTENILRFDVCPEGTRLFRRVP